jgi:hypothetical protein
MQHYWHILWYSSREVTWSILPVLGDTRIMVLQKHEVKTTENSNYNMKLRFFITSVQ